MVPREAITIKSDRSTRAFDNGVVGFQDDLTRELASSEETRWLPFANSSNINDPRCETVGFVICALSIITESPEQLMVNMIGKCRCANLNGDELWRRHSKFENYPPELGRESREWSERRVEFCSLCSYGVESFREFSRLFCSGC